jgi:hypothetical protein
MDTITIIYIVIAFILGAIITFFLKKGGKNNESDIRIAELTNENSNLKSKRRKQKSNQLLSILLKLLMI